MIDVNSLLPEVPPGQFFRIQYYGIGMYEIQLRIRMKPFGSRKLASCHINHHREYISKAIYDASREALQKYQQQRAVRDKLNVLRDLAGDYDGP